MMEQVLQGLPDGVKHQVMMSMLTNTCKRLGDIPEAQRDLIVIKVHELQKEIAGHIETLARDQALVEQAVADIETYHESIKLSGTMKA
jgi:hypothetical protein